MRNRPSNLERTVRNLALAFGVVIGATGVINSYRPDENEELKKEPITTIQRASAESQHEGITFQQAKTDPLIRDAYVKQLAEGLTFVDPIQYAVSNKIDSRIDLDLHPLAVTRVLVNGHPETFIFPDMFDNSHVNNQFDVLSCISHEKTHCGQFKRGYENETVGNIDASQFPFEKRGNYSRALKEVDAYAQVITDPSFEKCSDPYKSLVGKQFAFFFTELVCMAYNHLSPVDLNSLLVAYRPAAEKMRFIKEDSGRRYIGLLNPKGSEEKRIYFGDN